MLDEVRDKLNQAKEYCLSQCKKKDETTGKWVVDKEAQDLYKEAFSKIETNIKQYGDSLNFDTMFQTIIVNNSIITDDSSTPMADQWNLFGGETYTKILNTAKEDFFTGLASTTKVDEFANDILQSIGSDASARRNDLSNKLQPKLRTALDRTFSPLNPEKLSDEAKRKINKRIQKIFYDGKIKDIIQDYHLDVTIPSFLPVDN